MSEVTSLQYSTYRSAGDSPLALALQFDINPDITIATSSYDGRLVYEPYYTNTVSDNTWQTWNTQNRQRAAMNWWFSKAWIATETGCSQATPCTWTQVITALPHIGISGITGFKAGSNWSSGFTGNVDDFVIATNDGANATTTTYDFEPTPSDNGGGWRQHTQHSRSRRQWSYRRIVHERLSGRCPRRLDLDQPWLVHGISDGVHPVRWQ